MSIKGQKGQALLIVILVIVIALAIGLPIISKSISSLKSSTEEAESQKALSAAEAGIERLIQGSVPAPIGSEISANVFNGPTEKFGNNSSYSTQFSPVGNSGAFLVNGGNVISKDEGADIWFVSHDANGNPDFSAIYPKGAYLNIYWGTNSEDCSDSSAPAALEVVVVTRNNALPDSDPSKIKSYRYAYDGCVRGNNFIQSDNDGYDLTINNIKHTFKNRTTPQDGLAKNLNNVVLMRIIPIYKDTVIAVSGCDYAGGNCSSFPAQGYVMTSTGTSGQATRKIVTYKGWPQAYLPYISYGLFVAN